MKEKSDVEVGKCSVQKKLDAESGKAGGTDYAKIWREEHPDLAEDGIYYRKYTEDAMEEFTRGEWEEMYEAATGYKVDSELIRREEWRQEKQKK